MKKNNSMIEVEPIPMCGMGSFYKMKPVSFARRQTKKGRRME